MPWSLPQHKLFEWVAHGGYRPGLSQGTATKLAGEGVKPVDKVKRAILARPKLAAKL